MINIGVIRSQLFVKQTEMFGQFSRLFASTAEMQSAVPAAEVHGCDNLGLQPSYCMGV